MFENLKQLPLQLEELDQRINDPDTIKNQQLWQQLIQQRASLAPIVDDYQHYLSAQKDLEEAKALLESEDDEEMRLLAKEEIGDKERAIQTLQDRLLRRMLPKDPRDDRNVFVEIRQGAGGDEASLFAADVFRMYARYAERMGWTLKVLSCNENGLGGYKEIIFGIEGKEVYSRMKYESGVHLVKRVPVTESNGKLQTSTITVAVLPETSEAEVQIKPEDLRIDVYRSTGHGGQSVNTTDSAVRVTHLPTGMVVTCQDEKSQLKNRDQAIRVLRARLLEMERQKRHQTVADDRKNQIGSGQRSEKIRTYHFPQNRITDHRIGFTTHRVSEVMDGDLTELHQRLMEEDQSRRLKESQQTGMT